MRVEKPGLEGPNWCLYIICYERAKLLLGTYTNLTGTYTYEKEYKSIVFRNEIFGTEYEKETF